MTLYYIKKKSNPNSPIEKSIDRLFEDLNGQKPRSRLFNVPEQDKSVKDKIYAAAHDRPGKIKKSPRIKTIVSPKPDFHYNPY